MQLGAAWHRSGATDSVGPARGTGVAQPDPGCARPPLVSIGLPVHDGENYVAAAIASVLGQTLEDWELIICDNASTDATQAICEAHARRDSRVRYYRNTRNLGAGRNYDLAFNRSSGKFFKWLAHDDAMAPEYLEKTVACLERNPDAVLCHVGVSEIGPKGEVRRQYEYHMPGAGSLRPSVRLASVILVRHHCEPVFGLFRRDALARSGLHGTFRGSDRVLLAEMAMRGRWVSIPDPLFLHRDHGERYSRAILSASPAAADQWLDTSRPANRYAYSMRHVIKYGHYWKLVRATVSDGRERRACYRQLLRWWLANYHFRDAMGNVLFTIHPRLFRLGRAVMWALCGMRRQLPAGRPISPAGPKQSSESRACESPDPLREGGDDADLEAMAGPVPGFTLQ